MTSGIEPIFATSYKRRVKKNDGYGKKFDEYTVYHPIIQELFPDSGGYLRCVRDLKDNFRFDEFGCQASIAASSESFQLKAN